VRAAIGVTDQLPAVDNLFTGEVPDPMADLHRLDPRNPVSPVAHHCARGAPPERQQPPDQIDGEWQTGHHRRSTKPARARSGGIGRISG
jgi:hypothetical protein